MTFERRVIDTSRITRGFQMTITKKVRDEFGFDQGDLIIFVVEDGRLIIEKG